MFSFRLLLHTYFKCPDVRKCQVTGMHGCTFVDKVREGGRERERGREREGERESQQGELCDRTVDSGGAMPGAAEVPCIAKLKTIYIWEKLQNQE